MSWVSIDARSGHADDQRRRRSPPTGRSALKHVATAYLAFGLSRPALYQAMFVLPTDLRFAEAGSRPELQAAFEALAAVVTPFCTDVAVVTESFWAALHGLTELERSGRIRPAARDERIAFIVRTIAESGSAHSTRRSR
jgi:hypothetical protein